MSKRKFDSDEFDHNLAPQNSNKFARGLFANRRPVGSSIRSQSELLLAELADRRCSLDRQRKLSSSETDQTKLFAEELATLNERFVAYCQQSVHKDPHCFVFTGFNDYMEHFMGLFATYLAPLSDEPMTLVCLQRLRAHCSSKFANVGRFVSQVKDVSTSTDASIEQQPLSLSASSRNTPMDDDNAERLRRTFEIARKLAPAPSRTTSSSAGRRCREVMMAMQQMMHIPTTGSSRSSPVVSFAPVLLKNFNFNTSNSTLKESVSTVDHAQDSNDRKYFKTLLNREGSSRNQSYDGMLNQHQSNSRIWACSSCLTINHIDCVQCSKCSLKNNSTGTRPISDLRQAMSYPASNNNSTDMRTQISRFDRASNVTIESSTISLESIDSRSNDRPSQKLVNGICDSIDHSGKTDSIQDFKSGLIENQPISLGTDKTTQGWECPVCLVFNSTDTFTCVCCNASKDSSDSSKSKSSSDHGSPLPPATDSEEIPSFGQFQKQTDDSMFKSSPSSWFCTICMKIQSPDGSQTKCSNCGARRFASVGFKSNFKFTLPSTSSSISLTNVPVSSSLTAPKFAFGRESTGLEESNSQTKPGLDNGHAEDDSGNDECSGKEIDHREKEAIFATKCKMYYQHEKQFILKSVGFVSVLEDDVHNKRLLFRADNFNGTTMLTTKVNQLMNPILKEKNVMLLTIAYPAFFEDQDLNKPLVVLFKMKTREDAQEMIDSLKLQ